MCPHQDRAWGAGGSLALGFPVLSEGARRVCTWGRQAWGASEKVAQSKPALFAWIVKEKRFGTLQQELLRNENIFILEIRLTSGVQTEPFVLL